MGPEMRWLQLGSGDEFTMLTVTTWSETMPAGSICGLVTDVADPDATRDAMRGDGLECSELDDQRCGRYLTEGSRWQPARHRPDQPRGSRGS